MQFRARTAEVFEYAVLEVAGNEPREVDLFGGRDVSGEIIIQESGTWRILLFRGKNVWSSPDYPLVLEVDAPPVVTLQTPERDSQPIDQPLGCLLYTSPSPRD